MIPYIYDIEKYIRLSPDVLLCIGVRRAACPHAAAIVRRLPATTGALQVGAAKIQAGRVFPARLGFYSLDALAMVGMSPTPSRTMLGR